VSLMRYALGEADHSQKLGLTLKYTLDRAKMGRCANENGQAKASQLEIASYQELINH